MIQVKKLRFPGTGGGRDSEPDSRPDVGWSEILCDLPSFTNKDWIEFVGYVPDDARLGRKVGGDPDHPETDKIPRFRIVLCLFERTPPQFGDPFPDRKPQQEIMFPLGAVFSLFKDESRYDRFQAGRIIHFGPGMLERSDVTVEYEWSFLFSEPSEHVASVS